VRIGGFIAEYFKMTDPQDEGIFLRYFAD